jgi:hypothetical protein
MTVFSAALHKGLAVDFVVEDGIGLSPFSVRRNPIPFEATEMGVHRPAHGYAHLRRPGTAPLRIEPDYPCLDHHTTRTKAARGIPLPGDVPTCSRKQGDDLRAPSADESLDAGRMASSMSAAARTHSIKGNIASTYCVHASRASVAHSKHRDDVTAVYLLRSVRYQF